MSPQVLVSPGRREHLKGRAASERNDVRRIALAIVAGAGAQPFCPRAGVRAGPPLRPRGTIRGRIKLHRQGTGQSRHPHGHGSDVREDGRQERPINEVVRRRRRRRRSRNVVREARRLVPGDARPVAAGPNRSGGLLLQAARGRRARGPDAAREEQRQPAAQRPQRLDAKRNSFNFGAAHRRACSATSSCSRTKRC